MRECRKCKDNLILGENCTDSLIIRRICKKCRSEESYRYNRKLKIDMLNSYGGLICKCCGETEITFLSLDHIENDGALERKKILGDNHRNQSQAFYLFLKKNNWPNPKRYQVLCANCQWGKSFNKGICPHQQKYAQNFNFNTLSA